MDRHYSNLIIVREGELVPNGTFLIYERGGKSTTFRHLLSHMRKSDHDIKHAKTNIWKREIRPDHNVKSYRMKERRQRECLKS